MTTPNQSDLLEVAANGAMPGDEPESHPFPSRVYVCGHEFHIVQEHKSLEWAQGICYVEDCVIAVKRSLAEPYKRQTLMHELMHAIDHITLPGHADRFERHAMKEQDWRRMPWLAGLHSLKHLGEPCVVAWTCGLFSVMEDPRNRRFWRYIFGPNASEERRTDAGGGA